MNSNFFYLFYNLRDLYYLLNNHFYWNLLVNVPDYCFGDLNHLLDLHKFLYYLLYLNQLYYFVFLRNYLLHDLGNCYKFLLDYRNLHSFLHDFLNLTAKRHNLLDYSFNLFDPIDIDDFLLDAFDLLNDWNLDSHLHYLFNYFLNFFDFLNSLINRHNFLNDSLNNFRHVLDVIASLLGWPVFNRIYYLLHNLFNLDDDWLLYYPINNLFNYLFNFFDMLFDLFYDYCFLPDYLDLLYFWHRVIDDPLDNNRLLYLNYSLDNNFNLYYFRHLNSSLHYFLNNFRNLDNFFYHLFKFYNLLNNSVHILDHFNRDMNNFFDLFHSCICHQFLNNLLNWNYYWHLNYSFHYFFYDFWHLNNLVIDLEAPQDIFDIYAIYNLFVYHGNHRFINLWRNSSLWFYSFELLK